MAVLLLFVLVGMVLPLFAIGAEKNKSALYELRVYYAPPGKIDELQARFRDHTLRLFEKHGMTNVGYWVPRENPNQKLIYILAYPDRAAREKSWKAFLSDPEWVAVFKKSEKYGPLMIMGKLESTFLELTDYSPEPAIGKKTDRLFELRTYTTPEGKLDNLNARFREHTMELFEKHGMENIAYWTMTEDQEGAETKLIYLLAHESAEAREESFKAFGQDAEWIQAKEASEKEGRLTVPRGVQSVLLIPTDYSPMQ